MFPIWLAAINSTPLLDYLHFNVKINGVTAFSQIFNIWQAILFCLFGDLQHKFKLSLINTTTIQVLIKFTMNNNYCTVKDGNGNEWRLEGLSEAQINTFQNGLNKYEIIHYKKIKNHLI